MAGVGFELRAITANRAGSYWSTLRAFGAAAVISSGPWLISILTLLLLGIVGRSLSHPPETLGRFQVGVTWLFFSSLLLSGPLQLTFTRFLADRLYEERDDLLLPNLVGAMAAVSCLVLLVTGLCWPLFTDVPVAVRMFLAAGLGVLCNIWLAATALSALRQHLIVFGCFVAGYAATFGGALWLGRYGLAGLFAGFVFGQSVLLISALTALAHFQPGSGSVDFAFLKRENFYPDLAVVGLLFNLGIWIDKLLYWFDPITGETVLGPLRASEAYDLPIFLAYLSIVPGMAVFLVRVETDFAESHQAFYAAINGGAPLGTIEPLHETMIQAARSGLVDIFRIQGLVLALCALLARPMLAFFDISTLHAPLFIIDAAAVGMQVILLAVINVFFYLDRRMAVLYLCALLVTSNLGFSWITHQLGPAFYGYGFAIAMALTTLVALAWLSHTFTYLVRDTFMLQPLGRS